MKTASYISRIIVLAAATTVLLLSPALALDEVLASGTFEGKSKHKTFGSVSIVKTDGGYAVKLGDNFKFDGAPAPRLGLGKDGYKADTQFSKLVKDEGAQTYKLPATIDPSKYNEVWVWCEKFNVPLGLAKLN